MGLTGKLDTKVPNSRSLKVFLKLLTVFKYCCLYSSEGLQLVLLT